MAWLISYACRADTSAGRKKEQNKTTQLNSPPLPEETKDTKTRLNDDDGPSLLSPPSSLPTLDPPHFRYPSQVNPSLLLTYDEEDDDGDGDGDACQPFPTIPEFRSGIKLAANSLLVSE